MEENKKGISVCACVRVCLYAYGWDKIAPPLDETHLDMVSVLI